MTFIQKILKPIGAMRLANWNRKVRGYYDRFFTQAKKSSAHSTFCEQVYGKDLCQQGIMDMEQLNKLLEVLNLNKKSRVLELGCGNGVITQYMANETGAHFTGVDYSGVGIKQARALAQNNGGLSFQKADIKKLRFAAGSFDTIIAIDVLHFFPDSYLDRVIKLLKTLLTPGGQIGAFFTQEFRGYGSKESMQPENTRLAKILQANNLQFETHEFTLPECKQWKKQVKVLEELKPQFEAEGHTYLYYYRYDEAIRKVNNLENRRRFLYHVRMPG
jgi:cyclopropane fatty-acyl-phospholipid synthase-like methyltransferase